MAAAEEQDEEDEAEEKKGKKKKKKSKPSPKKKNKSAKTQKPKAKQISSKAAPKPCEALYKAGEYSEARKQYIQKWMKKGFSFKECSEGWKTSAKRQKLLANMSEAELKRRRFI